MIKTISISEKTDALIRAESERTGLKQSTIIEQAILARLNAETVLVEGMEKTMEGKKDGISE